MLHGYLGEWGRKGQVLSGLKVQAPSARSGSRSGRCFPVFPKVDALRARVDGAAGPLALGCQGSACDRLRLTGGLRAFALGRYIVSLRWRGGRPFGRQYKCRLWRRKPYNRPTGVGNAPLLVAGATTFPPAGGLYSSLCVSFILPLCTSCIGCASRSK